MHRSCSRIGAVCGTSMRSFTTSCTLQARRPKSHPALPVPSKQTPRVIVPENHALWGFFRNRQTMTPPTEDAKHGRSWSAEELRKKSFDDLHALWIICLKERNIIATQRHERRRQRIREAGNDEATQRDRTVRRTMAAIKFVLNERFLAYQQAILLAESDESVDLSISETEVQSAPETTAPKIVETTEERVKPSVARKAEQVFKLKADQLANEKKVTAGVV